MKRFARALVVVLGLAVLGSVVSLVPQKNAIAQGGGPTVAIASPLPLPVKGSVNATVSGTVAAEQSGNWNVGLSGTPTVQLANTTTPLLVKILDEPGRVPYNETVQVGEANSGCTSGFCHSTFTFPAVPANKRLVIQHVSTSLLLFGGGVMGGATLGPGNPAILGGHALPLTLQGSFQGPGTSQVFDIWILSQQITFYVDQSQQPTIDISTDSVHTFVSVAQNATITGYLVSLP